MLLVRLAVALKSRRMNMLGLVLVLILRPGEVVFLLIISLLSATE